jgi:hypothetical protein
MQRGAVIVSAALVVVGIIFIGQGTGLLTGRSFMVGQPFWAWVGAGCVLAGLVAGWRSLRGRAG